MAIFYLIIFLILGLFVGIHVYTSRKGLPPGPFGYPIIGSLLLLNNSSPYKTLFELSRKYGPIYGLYLGSVYTVVLSDVNLIKETLKRDVYAGRAPLFLTHGIMGGYGLICAEGSLWRDQRRQSIDWLKKLGMSKYSPSREILEKKIQNGAAEFLSTIILDSQNSNTAATDPMPALHHVLGNILNDLIFGITYKRDDATWKYLQELQEEGVKHIGVSSVVNFLPFLRYLPNNAKTIRFLLDGKQETHVIYDKIIANTLKKIEERSGSYMDTTKNQSIIEFFLCEWERREKSEHPSAIFFSTEQLRHVLADLFGAGVDTTITTMRWFLLYMAKNEEVQERLRKTFPRIQSEQHIPLNDLEDNDYFKACISEAQRIRSILPLGIPHGALDVSCILNYHIPKNTMIIPLQWAVHMDPKIWPNPERFDPERFLNYDGKYSAPSSFIPFQTGKRMCLGDELARMLLYIFCSSIIKNFKISLVETSATPLNMEGDCGITLTPSYYELYFSPAAEN